MTTVTSLVDRKTKLEMIEKKVKGLLLDYSRVAGRFAEATSQILLLERTVKHLKEENASLRAKLRRKNVSP